MTQCAQASRSKTIAIMQPYLLPYLGYFQLAAAVDEFWLLDTVGFIRDGWMNRNYILVNGRKHLFTLPVTAASHTEQIARISYAPKAAGALRKLRKTLAQSYARAAYLDQAECVLAGIADHLASSDAPADFTDVTEQAFMSVLRRIDLKTPVMRISTLDLPADLQGQERVIAACTAAGASDYINMIGGRDLYQATAFERAGVALHYLDPVLSAYAQGPGGEGGDFVPGLSVLDALAHLSPEAVGDMTRQGRILRAPL